MDKSYQSYSDGSGKEESVRFAPKLDHIEGTMIQMTKWGHLTYMGSPDLH